MADPEGRDKKEMTGWLATFKNYLGGNSGGSILNAINHSRSTGRRSRWCSWVSDSVCPFSAAATVP